MFTIAIVALVMTQSSQMVSINESERRKCATDRSVNRTMKTMRERERENRSGRKPVCLIVSVCCLTHDRESVKRTLLLVLIKRLQD